MSFIYQVLIRIAAPLVFIATWLRGLRDASYHDRLPERFGYTRLRFAVPPIWLHAVSVGEVQAAMPLIRRLLANTQQRPILVTTTTPTGAARLQAVFAAQVSHAYLPYDTPAAVRRFLQRVQPHCAIIMETELWPNLLSACVARDIPVVLASARISSRTAARYQQLQALFVRTMARVTVGAQTPADAERFSALGAPATAVRVTGNIKFDIEIPDAIRELGSALRQQWQGRPMWIAASTHEGEEQQIIAAHQLILRSKPNALLILAPRHPQRFAQVAALLQAQELSFVHRSSQHSVQQQHAVLLLDTLGELTAFYAAGELAFVGGSLVPVGGHNLLEPAALSLAVISGPHTFNAPEVADKLAEHGALRYVYSSAELAEVIVELFDEPGERQRLGLAAQQVVAESAGALAQLLLLIEQRCELRC